VLMIKITAINQEDGEKSTNKNKTVRDLASISTSTTKADRPGDNDIDSTIPAIVASSKQALVQLEACYEVDNCNFPSTDPREYGMAIGQAIKAELHSLYQKIETSKLTDESISTMARHYLSTPDGYIKEEALLILATQPTSEANLYAILNHVLDYHDANLTDMAMNELVRYKNSEHGQIINDYLKKNLLTGGHFAGLTIAKSISLFLNEDNIRDYQKIAKKMGPQSQSAKFLLASIEDYKKKHE